FGGGNKANRRLMEALAARGHECLALAKARADQEAQLARRGVACARENGALHYSHRGVDVRTFNGDITEAIARADADCILISDDKRQVLLGDALSVAPERVVLLVHTHLHVPFGPEALRENAAQHARMRRVRKIIALSDYVRDYLAVHGGIASTVLRYPIYDQGPFAETDGDFVTLINPCVEKGLPIFLALADAFPDVRFAAVPTWGADDAVRDALRVRPNVHVLPPGDEIGDVLRQTRVLLVPSLIHETFGHVAIDAMLRGIPVLASNLGGLPEAKLGVDYLLPVRAARRSGERFEAPEQDVTPWRETLHA